MKTSKSNLFMRELKHFVLKVRTSHRNRVRARKLKVDFEDDNAVEKWNRQHPFDFSATYRRYEDYIAPKAITTYP
jgi:hypothetical protein